MWTRGGGGGGGDVSMYNSKRNAVITIRRSYDSLIFVMEILSIERRTTTSPTHEGGGGGGGLLNV